MFDKTDLETMILLPEKDSYKFTQGSETVLAEFDSVSLSRKGTMNNVHILRAEWHLTGDEYEYFQGFFETKIVRGLNPFLLDLIIDTPDNQEHVVKFVENSLSTKEPTANSFIVNADLEVYPNDNTDWQTILILLYEDDTAFYSLTDAIAQFANVDCEPL